MTFNDNVFRKTVELQQQEVLLCVCKNVCVFVCLYLYMYVFMYVCLCMHYVNIL
jgi:hypothetical protein